MKIRIDPLDTLFSRFVRLRADYTCEYCGGKKNKMECSHFHSRRKKSVRYDPDNAACLCFSCHQHLGGNPYVHTEWFKKRLGDRFEMLNIRAETLEKIDKAALEIYLKENIKLLEEGK